MTVFKKATKSQSKLRMALYGVSGSGKTYSALAIATGLGGRVAVIDTERGSASKYAGRFAFDVLDMQPPYTPAAYVQAIKAAEAEGYDILIIDSLTHAWAGTGGALEMVDNAAKRSQSSNSYVAWRDVTPEHNKLIDAMIQSRCHIIATMRSKVEYVMEQNEKGKMVPRKKAMAPVQRDGMEYEFDVVAEMTVDIDMVIQKSRCETLTGQVISKPNGQVSATLRAWLSDGVPMPVSEAIPPATNGNTHDPAPALVQPAPDAPTMLAHLVAGAESMLANPPKGGILPQELDAIRANWSEVYRMAQGNGIAADVIQGNARPSVFLQAIVNVGHQVIDHLGQVALAEQPA